MYIIVNPIVAKMQPIVPEIATNLWRKLIKIWLLHFEQSC